MTQRQAISMFSAVLRIRCGLLFFAVLAAHPTLRAADVVDFEKTVAPLLITRCVGCHNASDPKGSLDLTTSASVLAGGEAGPPIEPGDPDASYLIERIREGSMPPEGHKPRLADDEINALAKWVAEGAAWPQGRKLSAFEITTTERAGYDWWALQPVVRPLSPEVSREEWASNPVDRFVLQQLERAELPPSPPADKLTLLRRAKFDLVGLPPTPEEIDEFLADDADDAYERLVDRYLASPHYGERWGRHWLDVVRYGESDGFEEDRLREHAWRYRDYVIDSFNRDKPYTQFLREQIAGDVIEPVTDEGIVATGLLVAGPWDFAQKVAASRTERVRAREAQLEELISVVGQSLMGLTTHCARCHDHKFDPITQVDYYRLKGVFEGVDHSHSRNHEPTPLPSKLLTHSGVRFQPEPTTLFVRGDVQNPGEQVAPGSLSCFGSFSGDLRLAADAPEGERRRRFAEWVTHPDHPLTARVMVNRLWQYHFGAPLVANPSDFGFHGGRPSHPELLDWLAAEFAAGEYRLKRMHKLLMTSRAYCQSSRYNSAVAEVDRENRLLWRFAPRRLEGEIIRDAMLAVSGKLNAEVGGPSFRPFKVTVFNTYFYHLLDEDRPEWNRRTVYRMNIDTGRDPLLDTLDCPAPSVPTPKRQTTTTALQALALMNHSFVVRQADALATRVRQASGEPQHQIAAAYRLALGRAPREDEWASAERLVAAAKLNTLCWALLNSSEFLYVR